MVKKKCKGIPNIPSSSEFVSPIGFSVSSPSSFLQTKKARIVCVLRTACPTDSIFRSGRERNVTRELLASKTIEITPCTLISWRSKSSRSSYKNNVSRCFAFFLCLLTWLVVSPVTLTVIVLAFELYFRKR